MLAVASCNGLVTLLIKTRVDCFSPRHVLFCPRAFERRRQAIAPSKVFSTLTQAGIDRSQDASLAFHGHGSTSSSRPFGRSVLKPGHGHIVALFFSLRYKVVSSLELRLRLDIPARCPHDSCDYARTLASLVLGLSSSTTSYAGTTCCPLPHFPTLPKHVR